MARSSYRMVTDINRAEVQQALADFHKGIDYGYLAKEDNDQQMPTHRDETSAKVAHVMQGCE